MCQDAWVPGGGFRVCGGGWLFQGFALLFDDISLSFGWVFKIIQSNIDSSALLFSISLVSTVLFPIGFQYL